MTKTEHIKKLIPNFYKGEVSIQDIVDIVDCHYSTASQVITRHKMKIEEVERLSKVKNDEDNFELSIKAQEEDNNILFDPTIGDWDNLTKKEQEKYY